MEGEGDVKSDVGDVGRFENAPPTLPHAVLELAQQLAALPPEKLAAIRALLGHPPGHR